MQQDVSMGEAPQGGPQQEQQEQHQQQREPAQLSFQAKGPQPLPDQQLDAVLKAIATAATQAMASGADPVAFARLLVGQVQPAGAKAMTSWVDADNAAILLDHHAPGNGWDMERNRRWLTSVWAELEKAGA
jgi:hypothetical protein